MPTVLIVDDDADLRDSLAETLRDLGATVESAADGTTALGALARLSPDLVLLDLRMPGMSGLEVLARIKARPAPPPVVILTAVPDATNTIEAMRLGAADHLAKPIGREDLARLLGRFPISRPARRPAEADMLVGVSAAMRSIQKIVGLLADTEAVALIAGEPGTGKAMVARAIHRHGRRRAKPFITLDCAALVREPVRIAFRAAEGGTLLLTDLDRTDAAGQTLLLAMLEGGGTPSGKAGPASARLLATIRRPLENSVQAGQFGDELFHKLGGIPIQLSPLRERVADVLPLAEYFLSFAAADAAPRSLSPAATALLKAHGWPGNVRELRNAMQRVSALVRRPLVEADDLGFLDASPATVPEGDWLAGTLDEATSRLERAMILRALDAAHGVRAEAARRLGIHRQLLHTKLRRYGLEASENRTDPVRDPDNGLSGST